jgi:hypothetical protein
MKAVIAVVAGFSQPIVQAILAVCDESHLRGRVHERLWLRCGSFL